jgi:hypothetical protein
MRKTWKLLLPLFLLLFGCTPKYATVEFGQAGGATNEYEIFIIEKSGRLLKQKGENGTLNFVRDLTKEELKTVHKKIKATNLIDLDISTPSNIYKFIEVKKADGTSVNRVVWGDPDGGLTVQLHDLYLYLMQIKG